MSKRGRGILIAILTAVICGIMVYAAIKFLIEWS